MSDSIKQDKDFIIAKMNHRNSMITAGIAAIVSLAGVIVPIYLANTNKVEAENTVVSPTKEEGNITSTEAPTITSTITSTPTEEPKKGKGNKD